MRYYPINLDLKGRVVVVVGGGRVAARKTLRLVAAGARVTLVAPRLHETLLELATMGTLRHVARSYRPGDLAGALLVFAATDDPQVNLAVADEARRAQILVDVADAPEASDFTTPALLEQGDLLVTVSTGGASPALARHIVEQLQPLFGDEYREALELLKRLREKILTEKGGDAYNERVFAKLVACDIPALIRNGDQEKLDQILLKLLGPELPLDQGPAEKKDPS